MSNALIVFAIFFICLLALGLKLLYDIYLGSGRAGSAKSAVPARNRAKAYYQNAEGASD